MPRNCRRCGTALVAAPQREPALTLEVKAKPTSRFVRVSTMEPLVVDTPAGQVFLEVGKPYTFPQTQIDELITLKAPIWILK